MTEIRLIRYYVGSLLIFLIPLGFPISALLTFSLTPAEPLELYFKPIATFVVFTCSLPALILTYQRRREFKKIEGPVISKNDKKTIDKSAVLLWLNFSLIFCLVATATFTYNIPEAFRLIASW